MHKPNQSAVPLSLSRLERRFAVWRAKRRPGQRIPKSLWKSAANAAAQYGLSRTALLLKLDYYSLQKHTEDASSASASPQAAFIELTPTPLPAATECLIEWEDVAGARLRVHLKGHSTPDLLALNRDFWNAE